MKIAILLSGNIRTWERSNLLDFVDLDVDYFISTTNKKYNYHNFISNKFSYNLINDEIINDEDIIKIVYEYFKNPNEELVEEIYQDLTKDLIKFKEEASDNVEFKDNDIVVDGRSIREAAKNKATIQHRIVEYIKLLIPEDGQSLDGIEYKDVEDEFPLAIQLTLVDKINEVIAPDYKETRSK